ncbi:MAG: M1 family aminopeptidase, partial [Caulobacteraceae bacterium]
AYLTLGLPALLLTSTAFFALATVTRSMMATYVGVVIFFVAYLVFSVWANRPEAEKLAALIEPFGAGAYGLATKYWTATEQNTLVPALDGVFLINRAMVLGVSALFLAAAFALFRWGERGSKTEHKQRKSRRADAIPAPAVSGKLKAKPRFDGRAAWAQLAARTRFDMGQVFKSPAFVVLLALGLFNALGGLIFAGEIFGAPIYPVTRAVIDIVQGAFTLIPLIIAIYYSGELVWRERDRKTAEIIDATPVPDWAFVVPKTLAISLVLVATLLASVVAAVLFQAFKGYTSFELDKYLLWYVLPNSIDMILIAVLAVFTQAISPHKFIGWGLMLLYVVLVVFTLRNVGFEHGLYLYANSPNVPLSDMNGMGNFWIGAAWYRVYWSAFAVVLLVLSYGLWRRGTETRLAPRLKRLPRRLNGPAGALAVAALTISASVGVWIYINTVVWNPYRTKQEVERWTADFERATLPFESQPQPKIIDERLDVSIEPHAQRVTTKGLYIIENKTAEPLREVHIRFNRDLEMRSLAVGGARPKTTLDRFNYRIFTFDSPMKPGERRAIAFHTVLEQRGFRNSGPLVQVVDNGTFINDRAISPSLGVDRNDFLRDRGQRRRQKLTPELRPAKLGTPGAERFSQVGRDSDFVQARITVTTDADQTPMAPGYKVSETVNGGRRTATFKTEAPILRFFSIQSARYAVRHAPYKGVDIAVYYDARHPWNVDRIINASKRSLDYFQANFSPYQFRQLRFMEFPVIQGTFAQSFAGTVPWSEGIGFIADVRDPEKVDYVTYVGAHEIAHQWWAHQVIGADEQGGTMLVETFAQYSALMVMKHTYGPDMIRKFLKYELNTYLRQRGGEAVEEVPLARVENQPYIHYRKGSLVMYRLQDEIGEAAVNRALANLIRQYGFKGAPFPTTLDFLRLLRAEAPADKQQLITDLFEKITLYDVKVTAADAKKRPDGRYDVTLKVSAKKLYATGQGKETEAPLNETFDVGLFTVEPGKKGFDAKQVISLQRLLVRSGVQTIRLIADKEPKFAGVDPYNKLIDRNSDDNVLKVGG